MKDFEISSGTCALSGATSENKIAHTLEGTSCFPQGCRKFCYLLSDCSTESWEKAWPVLWEEGVRPEGSGYKWAWARAGQSGGQ